MELRTLTLADALHVAQNMRQADRDCLSTAANITEPESYAVNRWQTDGPAWTLVDGEPVAIGGIAMATPWIGVAWMASTDRMSPASWKKLVRHTRTVLSNAARTIPRIEAYVLGTWPHAEKFARRCGFVLEGVRHRAGREGQDVLTFVYQQGNE